MMYPYMTLDDETEITHSQVLDDGRVKVYIETPVEDGFHNATCYLPDYEWKDISGYSDEEMSFYRKLIQDNAHLIRIKQSGASEPARLVQSVSVVMRFL